MVFRLLLHQLKEFGFHVLNLEDASQEYEGALSKSDRGDEIRRTLCFDVLMPRSKAMVILLNGNESDPQTQEEVKSMAENQGPVIGIRTGESSKQPMNEYLRTFMSEGYEGALFEEADAKELGLYYLARLREEIFNPSNVGEASHRTSILRHLQTALADKIPKILVDLDGKKRFPGTKIHDAVSNSEQLNADDITLSQLQMTSYICHMIEEGKPFPDFLIEYFLTSMLNGADGPIARKMGTTSQEGGIKDAAVDRLTEVMIARLIAKQTGMEPELSHRLQVSFQLSTLTKAASEMSGIKTKEGGPGGMIMRRVKLYFILRDLIKLNSLNEGSAHQKNSILRRINSSVEKLIEGSVKKAKERIDRIDKHNVRIIEAPVNPASSGASEARKYAGIVLLNNRIGVDIVGELNLLAGKINMFPSVESLKRNNTYIESSLGRAEEFLKEALTIAGY